MNASVGRRPKVLIVDDDSVQRLLASESLEGFGFLVAEADSGFAALPAFESARPDVVLLDVQMPGMDGFEVCSAIRHTKPGRHTPILMMTGLDDLDSIRRAYDAGATDFAVKPVNGLILGHRVEYMLRASRTTEALRQSQRRLEEAQRIAQLGYWEWDLQTDRLQCSLETQRIFGLDRPVLADGFESLLERLWVQDRRSVLEWLRNLVAGDSVSEIEYRVQSPNGPPRHLRQHAQVARLEGGQPTRVTGTVQDVTERRRAEERIRFLVDYDSLTGLPNRHSFSQSLRSALANARRRRRRAGLLFLDLDRFQRINDTLGHMTGDDLLQQVADRILERATGSATGLEAPTVVSRFGGDEFVMLMPAVDSIEEITQAAGRLYRLFDRPFELAGRSVPVTASIGVAIYPDDGESAETLLTNGNAAMYHAKAQPGRRVQFYSRSMNGSALDRLMLEADLGQALQRGELELWYQPQFDAAERLVGAEALLRWRHQERGLVSPGDFVPVAEESGLIGALGDWALERACQDAARWQRDGLGALRVAVNISPLQLANQSLLGTVERALAESRLDPRYLALELTESVLLESGNGAVLPLLRRLRGVGPRICIDDFGTGYSSLSYLSRFPIDSLKIDRSFVGHLPENRDQLAIVRAILAMAKSLKLHTVAEGVETEEQKKLLLGEGCHELQGFLLGRPMPEDEFVRRLAREPRLVPPAVLARAELAAC